jgi:hypothetical protein
MTTTRKISADDVVQMIERDLRRAFPATQFAVKLAYFGVSVCPHVKWWDGPTEDQVLELIDIYQGSFWNSLHKRRQITGRWMLANGRIVEASGEMPEWAIAVELDVDYVTCERLASTRLARRAIRQLKKEGDDVECLRVRHRKGQGAIIFAREIKASEVNAWKVQGEIAKALDRMERLSG